MIKKIGIVAALMLGFTFTSCEKDDDGDTTKPTAVVNSPMEDQEFAPGDSFQLDISMTDNEELSSLKVDIHYGGDHDHGKVASQWEYDQVWDLEGNFYEFGTPIQIPADAEHGVYHLLVFVTDASGNEAELSAIDIIVEDE